MRQKLRDGTITDEERKRLAELENWAKNMKLKELDALRKKLKDGTLTDEERRRLEELVAEELDKM